jgi:cell filamentation protein
MFSPGPRNAASSRVRAPFRPFARGNQQASAVPGGDGRTQRIFLDALARQAGHELYFDVVSRERMVLASIASKSGDLG